MASGDPDRRKFLGAMATIGAMAATGKSEALTIMPRPAVQAFAGPSWLAARCSIAFIPSSSIPATFAPMSTKSWKSPGGWRIEELPMPDYQMPFGVGEGSADDVIDFILTADCVDTAFTDFSTHVKFQVDYAGRHWSDSDGLFACMKRAMDNGIPILDGKFLARRDSSGNGAHFRRQHRTAHARRKNGNLASGGCCAGGEI